MLDLFKQMSQSILAVLGEDALLRGTVPCAINIEHGVQFSGMDSESARYRGDLSVDRDVATIPIEHNPVVGDTFTQGGKTYMLEHKIEDNGVNRRFVILETA
jgi:hypothetical protein